MFTEAYLESSRISTMELFSLRLNHILKAYLTRSNCLYIPFFTQHTLREKTYNCENFCLLLTIEQFLFRNSKLCNGMTSSIKKVF